MSNVCNAHILKKYNRYLIEFTSIMNQTFNKIIEYLETDSILF